MSILILMPEAGEIERDRASDSGAAFDAADRSRSFARPRTNDVVDSRSLAPTQHLPPTKAAIGPQRNFDLGPALPQRLDQPR